MKKNRKLILSFYFIFLVVGLVIVTFHIPHDDESKKVMDDIAIPIYLPPDVVEQDELELDDAIEVSFTEFKRVSAIEGYDSKIKICPYKTESG